MASLRSFRTVGRGCGFGGGGFHGGDDDARNDLVGVRGANFAAGNIQVFFIACLFLRLHLCLHEAQHVLVGDERHAAIFALVADANEL